MVGTTVVLVGTMALLVAVATMDILCTTSFAKHFKGASLKGSFHVDLTDGLADLAGCHVAL